MRKYLGIFLVLFLAGLILWQIQKVLPQETIKEKVLGAPEQSKNLEIEYEGEKYQAAWVEVKEIEDLKLIANFEAKEIASEAKEKFKCQNLISGGFYSESNQPIGLFISDYEKIQGYQSNNLFNGVLSLNDFAVPRITRTVPQDRLMLALQTGPILIENASLQKLVLTSDKSARRLVAATTGANELLFIVFWDQKSAFEGPKLIDLPKILEVFQTQTGVQIADAINLDGGTASAFYAGKTELSEASSIGSFFCF